MLSFVAREAVLFVVAPRDRAQHSIDKYQQRPVRHPNDAIASVYGV
jgi:hypothetical protein